jgi:hypothetical protein
MAERLGPVETWTIQEVFRVHDKVQVAIHVIRPNDAHPYLTLFTAGMTDKPLKVPNGQEAYRHAFALLQTIYTRGSELRSRPRGCCLLRVERKEPCTLPRATFAAAGELLLAGVVGNNLHARPAGSRPQAGCLSPNHGVGSLPARPPLALDGYPSLGSMTDSAGFVGLSPPWSLRPGVDSLFGTAGPEQGW